MKVSLKWLRDYVDLVVSPEELAHRLTMSGTEVAAVQYIGRDWEKIYVGQVLKLLPHPNADRLQLATVDYGGRALTAVTGAFNMKVGDKVAVALAGARLIDGHASDGRRLVLKPARLRGVLSEGIVCSEKELGLSEDHIGILILDPESQVGAELREELGDTILELEVTPNRPDCLSMIGVAREVAALTGQKVRLPTLDYQEAGGPVQDFVVVEIHDPDLSSRYSGSVVRGARVGPSPKWLRQRLVAADVRPINNVVDVTNYVMLEWGQPLHAFDLDTIRGGKIIVRRAREGEELTTLDGVTRPLMADMLVIADAERAVAVAGVMGGADTEVTAATRNIILESANFHPVSIRRTARALKLPSEASRRFEKGLPPEQTVPALRRATQLLLQLAGGQAVQGIADCYPVKAKPKRIFLTEDEVRRVLGTSFGQEKTAEVLTSLHFRCQRQGDGLVVDVPYHRPDVSLPADLVEEVARIIGYDAIPPTMPTGRLPEPTFNDSRRWEELARDILVGCGFTEVITYSLTSRERMRRLVPPGPTTAGVAYGGEAGDNQALVGEIAARLMTVGNPPVMIANPLSAEMECLRTTAMSSLLETLRDNLKHADRDVNLFEVGRIYLPRDNELPEERRVITLVMGSHRSGDRWGQRVEVDFYDLKGAVELLLERMGVPGCRFVPATHPSFHPSRAAVVLPRPVGAGAPIYRGPLGILGEASAQVCANFDLPGRAYLAGLDFEALLEVATSLCRYQELPKFPPVVQDIAVVVDDGLPAERVEATIRRAGGSLVRQAGLFDVYYGEPIPPGKKGLAYRITYQHMERTLTDEEVAQIHGQIERALVQELKAQLRGPLPR